MKQIKFITGMLLLAAIAFIFNACSDDDDKNNDSQNGKRISKVIKYDSNNNIYDSFSFQYTNGKLNKMIFDGEDADEPIIIAYSDKKVSIAGEINQTLQLNNAGFAESGTLIFDDSQYRFNCEYSNGYLSKVTYPDSEDNTRIEIKYDNSGNISTAYEYSDYGVTEFRFTLSNYPTKGKNIFLLGDLFGSDETLDLFWPAYYADLLGKDFQTLVSKVECIGQYNSYVMEFEYTFDKNGYIETMKEKRGNETKHTLFTYE